jgi:predicted DNA-binding protein
MEVHFSAEIERQLNEIAAKTGRGADELVQDVIAGYVNELGVQEMLDGRYDDLKSGRVNPVDGEAFFEQLGQREEERSKHSPR